MLLTVAALIALFGFGVGQLSRCQQHHQYPAFDRHRDGDRHRRLYLAVGRRFRSVGRLDRLVGQRAGDFAFRLARVRHHRRHRGNAAAVHAGRPVQRPADRGVQNSRYAGDAGQPVRDTGRGDDLQLRRIHHPKHGAAEWRHGGRPDPGGVFRPRRCR